MWISNSSCRDFLEKTPDEAHYLFASHSAFAADEVHKPALAHAVHRLPSMPSAACWSLIRPTGLSGGALLHTLRLTSSVPCLPGRQLCTARGVGPKMQSIG